MQNVIFLAESDRNKLLCMALRDILALVAREDQKVTLVQYYEEDEEDQRLVVEASVGQPHRSRSGSRGRDDSASQSDQHSQSAIEVCTERRALRLSNSRPGKKRMPNHHDFHVSLR